MRILHLIASVNPASGGPVEYARIMALEHARAGHESIFVTLDRPASLHVQAFDFEVHGTGPTQGPLKTAPRYGAKIARLAPDCDVAVVHGLWNYGSIGGYSAMRRAALPWVIFPHGMLDPYFRKVKPVKHLIKSVYWSLWQGRMLSHAKCVLFTCQEEQRLAHHAFSRHQDYNARVVAFCAADQSLAPEALEVGRAGLPSEWAARPYWLFLSRIHPKKAVDNLIRAYGQVAAQPNCPDLVIAGPDGVGWQAELQQLAKAEGVAERVHFPGMLSGSVKSAAFAGAEAFVLPSHQENFGLVVAEALSVGTPVLISDKVNIWPEVVEAGAGLVEPDTLEGTVRLLQRFMELAPLSRAALKAAARPCYARNFSAKAAAQDLLTAMQEAAG